MDVVTRYHRQHVRGVAWTAGDLADDTGVTRDNLSGTTTPTPATTCPRYMTNIDGERLRSGNEVLEEESCLVGSRGVNGDRFSLKKGIL